MAAFVLSDTVPDNTTTHDTPFVIANLPFNNPNRTAQFTKPYPDIAQTGVSIISALAPVYYTGTIANATFEDAYVASTGLDIHVDSISEMLDIATELTKSSFALLVDFDLDVIVISQDVVEVLYPPRTGSEVERATHDLVGNLAEDRRNVTYRVSDTIFQGEYVTFVLGYYGYCLMQSLLPLPNRAIPLNFDSQDWQSWTMQVRS